MKTWMTVILKFKFTLGIIVLFGLAATYVNLQEQKWEDNRVFQYDTYGYHNYLPAFFIYHDLAQLQFIDSINQKYQPIGNTHDRYGMKRVGNNLCLQYPIGVALFQAPGFLLAHAHTLIYRPQKADGYAWPYQVAAVFSTLFFALLGLLFLAKFLLFYLTDKYTAFTLLIIIFGTNFFHYATLESGLSHIYLFFTYAAMLFHTKRWHDKPNVSSSLWIGACIGLAAVLRPLDALLFFIPICWNLKSLRELNFWKRKWTLFIAMLCACLICVSPQLIYWHSVSGQWIFYSYPSHDYFQFNRMRIIQGLFGYRKGWFLYSPLLLIAVVYLFFGRKERYPFSYRTMLFIFFAPMIYLVFAWHCWFYGWSFGCRALLQTIPLLALPLGYGLQALEQWKIRHRMLVYVGIFFLVFLNLFQIWQYNHYILPGDRMNEMAYWRIFLKTESPPEMEKIFYRQAQMDYEAGW